MVLPSIRDSIASCVVAAAATITAGCNRPLEVGELDGGAGGNAGSGNRTPGCPPGTTCRPEQYTTHYFEQNVNNDIDILIMMDNSSSTENKQSNFVKGFPIFIDVLKTLPAGLPNVHIGVVSSALGAGAFADVPGCPPNGDRGAFQNAPRGAGGTCTAVPRDHYIISLEKGTKNNFDGDISDVFRCITDLGQGGCGFEHQLASAARALGANLGGWTGGAPSENAGFLRPDAFLAVILVTDEDDCSAPVDSDLFDPGPPGASDEYGPLQSFRCTEFGILCDGAPPPRTPISDLTNCHDAGPKGKLIPVSDFVQFFKTVKRVPNRVLVSAIAAPPEPFSVAQNGNGWPVLLPSCTGGGADGNGDPAVRIKDFVDAFGRDGTFNSICADSRAPTLNHIAMEIGKRLGAQCIDAPLKDSDAYQDGVQPECTVVDQSVTAGGTVATPLPNCALGGGGGSACWTLVSNTRDCTASGFELKVDRGSNMARANTVTVVSCATCTDGSGEEGCP